MHIGYIILFSMNIYLNYQEVILMYRTQSKDDIGKYLKFTINNKCKSYRSFCKEYLMHRDSKEPDNTEINNMANRLCQIIQGNKEIQIEDLPIFAEILEISVDDILSAGTYSNPAPVRTTNYSIAYSKDKKEWEKYLNREDKLILNPDEYNKTLIDYALEAGNYPLLKYLMDNGFIWFVSEDQKEYVLGFGAGTKIERRKIGFTDPLDIMMKESDDLRFKMIALAINNKDYKMLDTLHAREIYDLYNMTNILHRGVEHKKLPVTNNIKDMIQSIAASESTTIEYFFEEYSVKPNFGKDKYSYVFPYADILLKELIKKNPKKAKPFLEKAIAHNKKINTLLLNSINSNIDLWIEEYKKSRGKDSIEIDQIKALYTKDTWCDYYFYPENGFLSYIDRPVGKKVPYKGFITNVIHVEAKSNDKELQSQIDKLNAIYNQFSKYLKNKEK